MKQPYADHVTIRDISKLAVLRSSRLTLDLIATLPLLVLIEVSFGGGGSLGHIGRKFLPHSVQRPIARLCSHNPLLLRRLDLWTGSTR